MFTEGNWTVTKWSGHIHLHISSDIDEKKYGSLMFVADCGNSKLENGLPYNPDAEENARLISAAPDLYYALKAILNKRVECHETESSYIPPEIEMAYKVIEKAEGKDER